MPRRDRPRLSSVTLHGTFRKPRLAQRAWVALWGRMSTVLDRIKAYKLEDVAARKAARPLAAVEAAARAASPPRSTRGSPTAASR